MLTMRVTFVNAMFFRRQCHFGLVRAFRFGFDMARRGMVVEGIKFHTVKD